MKRYLKLYNKFLQQYLKSLMEYRADFITGLIGFFFSQSTGVIFLTLIFNSIPNLQGWSFYEILFIYGFAQIPRGIDHVFTDNLWIFGWKHIVKGDFDRYLIRPLNPLFQLIAEKFQPDGFGEILVGTILVFFAGGNLGLTLSITKIILFLIAILAGTFIYTSIKLAAASLAFWVKISSPYISMTYQLSTFAKYPVSIYPSVIKNIVTYVVPFAFTGFYPASYFLGKGTAFMGIAVTCLIAFIFIIISYNIWNLGIKKYESSGN